MVPGSSRITMLSGGAALYSLVVRGKPVAWMAAWLVVVAACCASGAAQAQQYKADPVNDRLRLDAIPVQNYVRNPSANPADKPRYDAFFTQYYFPAMTRFGPDQLGDLGGLRQDLFTRFLWRSQSEELQRDLTEKAFKAVLPIIASSEYHPAVRYNAILVLGLLDEQYAIEVGANRRPPKPLPQANDILIKAVGAAVAGKLPPPLLVGALIGLERHAKYHQSLPPENVARMTAAAQSVLDLKQPLPNLDSDVTAWIKLEAADVLAELGAVGTDNKDHLALMRLVGDHELSLDDRCRAAALLAKLNYDGVKLDGKTTVDPFVQLAVAVANSEGKRAKKFLEVIVPTDESTRRLSLSPRSRVNPEEAKYDRRPLLSRLMDLRRGLGAVKGAVPADEQPKLETLLAELRTVEDSATDDGTIDLRLVTQVQELASQIRAAAKAGAADSGDAAPAAAL